MAKNKLSDERIKTLAKAAKKAGFIKTDLRKPVTRYTKDKIKRLMDERNTRSVLRSVERQITKPEEYRELYAAERGLTDTPKAKAIDDYMKGANRNEKPRFFTKKKVSKNDLPYFKEKGFATYGQYVYLPKPTTDATRSIKHDKDGLPILVEKNRNERHETNIGKNILEEIEELREAKEYADKSGEYSAKIGNYGSFRKIRNLKDLEDYIKYGLKAKDANQTRDTLLQSMSLSTVDHSPLIERELKRRKEMRDNAKNKR